MKNILLISIIFSMFVGCTSKEEERKKQLELEEKEAREKQHQLINKVINAMPTFPMTKNSGITPGKSRITYEVREGVKYKCTTDSMSQAEVLDEIVAFHPNTGILYPGALIKGNSLNNGVLNPIDVKRNSGTVTISYQDFKKDDQISVKVKDVNFDNVNKARKQLVNQIPDGKQVAILDFQKTESHSLEESFLKIGMSAKWLKGSFKARLDQGYKSNTSKYFLKIIQSYYDISFETDYSGGLEPADYFSPEVLANEVETGILEKVGNPPTYIKSITYGRMLLVFIESSSVQDSLNAAVEAKFSGYGVSGQLDLSAGKKTALDNSKITLISLGGAAEGVVKLISGNKLDSLMAYVKNGQNFSKNSPAFPISYVCRYLKNNEAAHISYTTNYVVPKCVVNPREIDFLAVTFTGISDDKDATEDVTFQVINDGDVVARLTTGKGQKWDQQWYEEIPITGNLDELDKKTTILKIQKGNQNGGGGGYGAGFIFSGHNVYAHFAGDPKNKLSLWYSNNNRLQLGNGNINDLNIDFK